MARAGRNPLKNASAVAKHRDITITTVVHIPELAGYWRDSLKVLQVCLDSMRRNTNRPFDLMVFDNNSCVEARRFLVQEKDSGNIDCLILSDRNIGKVGAWNHLFGAAQSPYVSYTDSDVLFLPGWLEASLEILRSFPEAGQVTAQPALRIRKHLFDKTISGAKRAPNTTVEWEARIPERWLEAHRVGLGETEQKYNSIRGNAQTIAIARDSMRVFASASHFQFTSPGEALKEHLPLATDTPIGHDEIGLDSALNEAGRWRLSTDGYFVHHLGNRLTPNSETLWIYERAGGILGKETTESTRRDLPSWLQRALRGRLVRPIIKSVNLATYRMLYE